ncbi:predicted protein, partial [Mycobacterium tuberculosis T17]
TIGSFNALREDFTALREEMTERFSHVEERFSRVDDGFTEMRGKLDGAAAGQQRIVELIEQLIADQG